MSVQITYNGEDPFGIYVPQIERDQIIVDNNGYISSTDRFTLSGFLVKDICSTTWAQYHEAMLRFMAIFSKNFGEFIISGDPEGQFFVDHEGSFFVDSDLNPYTTGLHVDTGVQFFVDGDGSFFTDSDLNPYVSNNFSRLAVYRCPRAIVRSISFEDNSFYNLVPYVIEIDCIRSYQNLNILDPVDQWSTDQGEDSIVTITHTMSCRGVGPNALASAKSFLENTRNNSVLFSIGTPVSSLPIIFRTESQNRLTGEYSLTEVFLYNEDDPAQLAPGIITYSSDIQEGQGVTEISITGEIRENVVDQGDVLSLTRSKFDSIDWDAIAAQLYGSSIDKKSISVQENKQTGTVSFTLTYNSLSNNSPYLIDETTITRDLVSGRDCISLRLTVQMDYGCVGSRFVAVKTYAAALNINSILLQKWAKFGPGGNLSTTPENKSWTENPIEGSVTLSVQHCTKTSKECGCLQNFDYTLEFNPGANQYVANPIYRAAGFYDVQNLNSKTRTRYGLTGSATVAKCCSNEQAIIELRGRVNSIGNFYFLGKDKILEEANITTTKNKESLNFSFRWSVAPE